MGPAVRNTLLFHKEELEDEIKQLEGSLRAIRARADEIEGTLAEKRAVLAQFAAVVTDEIKAA